MTLTRLMPIIATTLVLLTGVAQAQTARFEVTSIKAIRAPLVSTIAALQSQDLQAAKDALESYDAGWNGVEVYINVRHAEAYKELEGGYQARITQGLNAAMPDFAALLTDAKAMLAKLDEEIAAVEKSAPMNRFFDDVARLRLVRADLRAVTPALKAGKLAKAKQSFVAFDDKWGSVQDLIKERSSDAYVAIESGRIEIEKALMPAQPNVDNVITLVAGVMDRYNQIVAQITKEARSAK